MSDIFQIIDNHLVKYLGNDSKVIVPNGIISIDDFAFFKNGQIEEVLLPEGIKSIGAQAFFLAENIKSINFPSTLEVIEASAFSGCISLTEIKLPEGLKTIDSFAFFNCKNLVEIKIPQSVYYLGNAVFYNCISLRKVFLPANLSFIRNSLFKNCKQLSEVLAPSNLKVIGSDAFKNCINLHAFNIPACVERIAPSAFNNVPSMINVKPLSSGSWTMRYTYVEDGVVSESFLEHCDYCDINWIKELNGLSDYDEVTNEDIPIIIDEICYCLALGEKTYFYRSGILTIFDDDVLRRHLEETEGKEFAEQCDLSEYFTYEYLSKHPELMESQMKDFEIVWTPNLE